MNKHTLALACILKNEVRNLPRMMESVRGCFDEIHLTDTGSTDGSIELIQKWISEGHDFGAKIFLHHFQWCDDFSAARNASFEPVKTDYVMWMDLDDVLGNREAFLEWRENGICLADYHLATYQYSIDKITGKSLCSFTRERVFRTGLGLKWKYFLHEGVLPESPVRPVGIAYAQTWHVKHLRDDEDLKADKMRNLSIFEKHGKLEPRMQYYYGKELAENGKPLEGFSELIKAVAEPSLQQHDRVMGLQYAAMAAMQLNQFERAIQLAHQGLQLAPNRAEFLVIIGDSYIKLGKIVESVPYFAAASSCPYHGHAAIQGPTFAHEDSYKHYPLNQLARIYANMGDLDRAEQFAKKAIEHGPHPESMGILNDILTVREKTTLKPAHLRNVTSEVVITCPPQGLYDWDWKTYQERGIGGSETAACEMAKWISELTGRKVIIFTPRKDTTVYGGFEFRPAAEAPEYFRDNKPALHIAWRHCTRFNDEPLYVWCHDLVALGMEQQKFDKILALSPFHKGFLKSMHGIAEEKIWVTGNGIDPERFKAKSEKNPHKVVFSSSPDRGLEAAMLVMDQVVKEKPEAELHVYYGFENMMKMGMQALAAKLQGMMAARPYVKFHGNVPQKQLTKEISDAAIWLYPTNFLETYCITAVEMVCSGVYPIVRDWGALPYTLGPARSNGMASVLDIDPSSVEGVTAFAKEVLRAFDQKLWEKVTVDPNEYSWENRAREWIEYFGLEAKCQLSSSM